MANYIDGFIFPLSRVHMNEYKKIAEKVAEIWKEYGALAYFEYYGDDLILEGTRSFAEALELKESEVVVFGWVVFPSKEVRDKANKQVPTDPRMADLVTPLTIPDKLIFDASRIVSAGFKPLVQGNG